MAPKASTRIESMIANDPGYDGHTRVTASVVVTELEPAVPGERETGGTIYDITHARYKRTVTESILVTEDAVNPDIAYLWMRDPAEVDPEILGNTRPPYSTVRAGRRWVPVAIQDSAGIWAITGAERDYSDPAIGLLEAYWIGQSPMPAA